jgi:Ca2+-binding RTX toxin-like protein
MQMGRISKALSAGVTGLVVGAFAAPAALASTVSVTGGDTVRVAETGNESNAIVVSYDAGTDTYTVHDGSATLTPSGPCVMVDAHTATCPGAGIKTISVDTGDRADSIAIDSTVPATVAGNLDGGPDNDTVTGGAGQSTVRGDSGNDTVAGRGTVDGGSGNDTVTGSSLADTIRGGRGRDVLNGADGPDDIAGGSNTDTLVYPASRANPIAVTVGSGNGNDGGPEDQGSGRRDTVHGDIEVVIGTALADVLIGDNSSETLLGLGGDDVLNGNGGGDTLLGFDGNDLLIGESGNDTNRGGPGDDRLFGKSGNDRLAGGPNNDFLRGGFGVDVMKGKTGIDRINAHDGTRDVKISCGPGQNSAEGAKRDRGLDPRPKSC